jgi:hypothetical protein
MVLLPTSAKQLVRFEPVNQFPKLVKRGCEFVQWWLVDSAMLRCMSAGIANGLVRGGGRRTRARRVSPRLVGQCGLPQCLAAFISDAFSLQPVPLSGGDAFRVGG